MEVISVESKPAAKWRFFISFSRNRPHQFSNLTCCLQTATGIDASFDKTGQDSLSIIPKCDVFLVAVSEESQCSDRCKLEAECAWKNNMIILPVAVEPGAKTADWLLALTPTAPNITLHSDSDLISTVTDQIFSAIENRQQKINKFKISNFPSCRPYLEPRDRTNKDNFLEKIRKQAEGLRLTNHGLLIVAGDEGIGKTYFVANLLQVTANHRFFVNKCCIDAVHWVDCCLIEDIDLDEETANGIKKRVPILHDWNSEAGTKVEPEWNQQVEPEGTGRDNTFDDGFEVLCIFDNVQNFQQLRWVHENFSNSHPVVVIARSSVLMSIKATYPQWMDLISDQLEIGPMSNGDLGRLLTTTHRFGGRLSGAELRQVVDSFFGSPRLAAQYAQQINKKPVVAIKQKKRPSTATTSVDCGSNLTLAQKRVVLAAFQKKLDRIYRNDDSPKLPLEATDRDDLSNGATTQFESEKVVEPLKCINVPKFEGYVSRPEVEEEIRNCMCSTSKKVDGNNNGLLVISGEAGVGKTSSVAHVILTSSEWLPSKCGVQIVVWLNCHRWKDGFIGKDEGRLERQFSQSLLDLCKQIDIDKTHSFRRLDHLLRYYKQRNKNILFVLDDVFHSSVLASLLRHVEPGSKHICLAITRNPATSRLNDVNNTFRIGKMSNAQIKNLLTAKISSKNQRIDDRYTNELSDQCNGDPSIAFLVGNHLRNCESHFLEQKLNQTLSLMRTKDGVNASRLFRRSAENLSPELRQNLLSFLLFDAEEPLELEELSFLGTCNEDVTKQDCAHLASLGLVNRIIPEQIWEKERFSAPKLLHENADSLCGFVGNSFQKQLNCDRLSANRLSLILNRQRASVQFDSDEDLFASFFDDALSNKQRALLEKILDKIRHLQLPFDMNSSVPSQLTGTVADGIETTLLVACRAGFLDAVRFLAARFPTQIAFPDKNGSTTLIEAAKNGHLNTVRFLVEKWSQLAGLKDKHGWNALILASCNGHIEVVKFLNEKMKSLPPIPVNGNNEDDDMVAELPEASHNMGNSRFRPQSGVRGRVSSARSGGRRQVSAGGHPRISDPDVIKTAFILATDNGHLEVVRFFVEEYPEEVSTARSKSGETSLAVASKHGYLDIVTILTDRFPEEVNFEREEGLTALSIAVSNGQTSVARFLTENFPETLSIFKRAKCRLLLIYGLVDDNVESIDFLIERYPRDLGLDPIQTAKFSHPTDRCHLRIQLIKVLASRWADCLKLQLSHGVTPLIKAALIGDLEVVKILLDTCPSSVNLASSDRWTPLVAAAASNKLNVVRYLAERFPALTSTFNDQFSLALEVASHEQRKDVLKFFVSKMKDHN